MKSWGASHFSPSYCGVFSVLPSDPAHAYWELNCLSLLSSWSTTQP